MTGLSGARRLPLIAGPAGAFALAALVAVAQTSSADRPAPKQSTARFEQRFMTGMIDHHGMAIAMSEICLRRAVHDQLRQMCQDVITAQTEETKTMQAWLGAWYGVSHEPEMSKKDERQLAQLEALEEEEFERTS